MAAEAGDQADSHHRLQPEVCPVFLLFRIHAHPCSETQLRSRLKKWRVTKPSRQTRKKPAEGQADNDDDEEDVQEDMSPAETKNVALQTPTPQSQPAVSQEGTVSRDWYAETWAQAQPQQQQQQQLQQPQQPQQQSQPEITQTQEQAEIAVTAAWTAPVSAAPQLSIPTEHHVPQNPGSQLSTPAVSHFPSHGLPAGYDLQQSPQTTVPTTQMVSPTYASYPMAPMSYPQSATPTAIQWPTATDYIEPDVSPSGIAMPPTNWFTAQYDAASAVPHAYYQRAVNPISSNYSHMMQSMPQDMSSSYQPQMAGFQGFDENAALRPWRRAVSSQFQPEAAPALVRVDRQGRQRKPHMDRKRKESAEEMNMSLQQQQPQMQPVQSAHHPMQAVMPPQYIAAGHHSMMPQDIYTYAGHEQLLQRPIGH